MTRFVVDTDKEPLVDMGSSGKYGLWRTARLWQSLLLKRINSVQKSRWPPFLRSKRRTSVKVRRPLLLGATVCEACQHRRGTVVGHTRRFHPQSCTPPFPKQAGHAKDLARGTGCTAPDAHIHAASCKRFVGRHFRSLWNSWSLAVLFLACPCHTVCLTWWEWCFACGAGPTPDPNLADVIMMLRDATLCQANRSQGRLRTDAAFV